MDAGDKVFKDATIDQFRDQIAAAARQNTQFTIKDIPVSSETQNVMVAMKEYYESLGWRVNVSVMKDGDSGIGSFQAGFSPPLPTAQPVPKSPVQVTVLRQATAKAEPPTILSVIFGTYNRFDLLQKAVSSVRSSIGSKFAYEIVVCDGGSTDESRVWLAMQRDVVLIGERRLEGAVRAFNQCFRMSRGEYIANLNDDCVVEGSALADGVAYLKANRDAGQVAFMFRGEDDRDWHINEIYPKKDNPDVSWPTEYVNFGITRRQAAEQVAEITGGFWNPIYKTYSGDCELSAWIHKLGWKIARMENHRVLDVRHSDGLRDRNNVNSGLELKRFWFRWPADALKPDGPMPNASPEECERFLRVRDWPKEARRAAQPGAADLKVELVESMGWPEPGRERFLAAAAQRVRALDPVEGKFPTRAVGLTRERVLHVHINGKDNPDQQAGLVRALLKLGSAGFAQVRWPDLPHEERQRTIIGEATRLQPTLVFMQLQTPGAVDVETVHEIRRVVKGPVVIATWNGDIASENSPWRADWQAAMGRAVDLTLHSSLSHVHVLRALGIHTTGYLQIGVDTAQYRPRPPEITAPQFDVCFLGSRYNNDVFSQSLRRHDAQLRDAAVDTMRGAFGERFGLFGGGYDPPRETVPVTKAHEVYWRSRMGLNVSLSNDLECYSSDRLFRIMGCGCLLLTKAFPMMSVFGLKMAANSLIWESPEQAVLLAQAALDAPEALEEMAAKGAELVRDHHSWDVRMTELVPYLNAIRGTPRT